MSTLASSLYLLGVIGAVSAVRKTAPMGMREWVISICWPLAVAYAVAFGLSKVFVSGFRP